MSVNGVSKDVARMRDELRAEVVELEVLAPDRWRYAKARRPLLHMRGMSLRTYFRGHTCPGHLGLSVDSSHLTWH